MGTGFDCNCNGDNSVLIQEDDQKKDKLKSEKGEEGQNLINRNNNNNIYNPNQETIAEKEKNELEETILEIEKDEMEIFHTFNEKNKKPEEKEIELKTLSQYYINPEKEKANVSYSNQIIVTFKDKINPFNDRENIDKREDIQAIKANLKKIEDKYKQNKQILIKPFNDELGLHLMQKIESEYNFTFQLTNIKTGFPRTVPINDIKNSILFIIFDINKTEIVQKIKHIKKYKDEFKDKNDEKYFSLFLIIKENVSGIKEIIKNNKLGDCYFFLNYESYFNKFFGKYEEFDSKCIFINKDKEISLILENDIEFLSNDTIEYYLKSNSKNEFDCYKKDDKYSLKSKCEENNFKNYLGKLKEKYNIQIEFRKIDNKKYPVNIRFEYHQDDENAAKEILKELEKYIKDELEIKKHFIVKKIKKDDNKELINEIKDDNKELTNEINGDNKEPSIESEVSNGEQTKINIKIRVNEKETYSNKWNKTEKIDLIKKDFVEKYPDYENCLFLCKGKMLKASEDLNHYKIQDNDEIIIIIPD